jgi:hypothetical protein
MAVRRIYGNKREHQEQPGQNCIITSFMILLLVRCYYGDEIKEGIVGQTCGSHGNK